MVCKHTVTAESVSNEKNRSVAQVKPNAQETRRTSGRGAGVNQQPGRPCDGRQFVSSAPQTLRLSLCWVQTPLLQFDPSLTGSGIIYSLCETQEHVSEREKWAFGAVLSLQKTHQICAPSSSDLQQFNASLETFLHLSVSLLVCRSHELLASLR